MARISLKALKHNEQIDFGKMEHVSTSLILKHLIPEPDVREITTEFLSYDCYSEPVPDKGIYFDDCCYIPRIFRFDESALPFAKYDLHETPMDDLVYRHGPYCEVNSSLLPVFPGENHNVSLRSFFPHDDDPFGEAVFAFGDNTSAREYCCYLPYYDVDSNSVMSEQGKKKKSVSRNISLYGLATHVRVIDRHLEVITETLINQQVHSAVKVMNNSDVLKILPTDSKDKYENDIIVTEFNASVRAVLRIRSRVLEVKHHKFFSQNMLCMTVILSFGNKADDKKIIRLYVNELKTEGEPQKGDMIEAEFLLMGTIDTEADKKDDKSRIESEDSFIPVSQTI